jgi:hypothetical protein
MFPFAFSPLFLPLCETSFISIWWTWRHRPSSRPHPSLDSRIRKAELSLVKSWKENRANLWRSGFVWMCAKLSETYERFAVGSFFHPNRTFDWSIYWHRHNISPLLLTFQHEEHSVSDYHYDN